MSSSIRDDTNLNVSQTPSQGAEETTGAQRPHPGGRGAKARYKDVLDAEAQAAPFAPSADASRPALRAPRRGLDVSSDAAAQAAAKAATMKAATPDPATVTTERLSGDDLLVHLVPTRDSTAANMLAGAQKFLRDSLAIAHKHAEQHHLDGPDRILLLNFLKEISGALDALNKMLASIESSDAATGRMLTFAQMDDAQGKIAINKKAADDAKAQQDKIDHQKHKAGVVSLVMKIVTPIAIAIMAVATIASFGTLGPAAIAISTIMLGLMITSAAGGPDVMAMGIQKAADGIAFLLDNILGRLADAIGVHGTHKWFELYGKMVAITALMVAGDAAAEGEEMGTQVAIEVGLVAFSSSNLAGDTAVDFGASPQTAAIIAGITTAILVVGAAFMRPKPEEVEEAIEGLREEIGNLQKEVKESEEEIENFLKVSRDMNLDKWETYSTVAKEMSKNLIRKINIALKKASFAWLKDFEYSMTKVEIGADITKGGLGLSNALIERNINAALGQMAEITAWQESESEYREFLVKILQEVIQRLLGQMAGTADWSAEINKLQIKIVDDNRIPNYPA